MQTGRIAVRSPWSLILLVAAGLLLLQLATAASAQAAECTDTYTGPAEGFWTTKGNWSAGHVPTSSDVACIPSGKTPELFSAETGVVSLLLGEGGLKLAGGSLELTNTLEASSIRTLSLSSGQLKGAGTLQINGTLTWTGGVMAGSGTTELLSGAEGAFSGLSAGLERRFINKGSLKLTGRLIEYTTAELINESTFTVNSEAFPAIEAGKSATTAKVVNNGTLQKTSGKGNSSILVPLETKNGTVVAKSGTLDVQKKITSAETVWEGTEGGVIQFDGNEATIFSVKGGSWRGAITNVFGALEAEGVNAEAADLTIGSGYVSVASGTMTVKSLTLSGGKQKGAGTLRVSGTLTWNSGPGLYGSGTTVLLSGAEGTISAWFAALERRFVNKGSLKLSGSMIEYGTAELINEGTFTVNSGKALAIEQGGGATPSIINAGVLQRTAGTETTAIVPPFQNFGSFHIVTGNVEIQHEVKVKASTATPGHACIADPVDCATGNFIEAQSDFEIGGRGVGLDLVRTYSAQAAKAEALGIFGYGWTNSFGDKLTSEESGAKQTLTEAPGSTVTFTKSGAAWIAPAWSRDALTGSAEAGFTLTLANQTKVKFNGSGRLESVTDRNGNETTLAYNGSGKLETITDPTGRKITLTYNGEGLVEKAKDPMGHEVKYAYEGKNLKSVTLPGEASANWQFKYDGSRRMTSMTDGRGGKTTNEYDSSSRVISQTDPAERKTSFEYAPFHTKISNKATGAVTDEWFNSNNQVLSITHGFGTAAATTESFGYTAAGLRASRTDGNGHTWAFGYDGSGNRTSEVDPLEHETKWTYNQAHQVLSETKPSGEKTTIVRDANGNPESVTRPAPESKTQTVTYKYGAHGELESMTNPLGHAWSYEYDSHGDLKAETDPEGDKRSWGYDEDSRVISAVSPRGNEEGAEAAKFMTTVERDAQERLLKVTDPLEGTTKYAYDAAGNIGSITDPNNRKTKLTYNAANEQTKVELPNGAVEETGYDGSGEVTSQTDGNKQKTTYVRNVLEQPVEVIDPLERKTTQTFDAAGNLKTKKDPDGRTTNYGYDNANQLKEISYSDGITPKATFGYDKNGNLTSMSDGTGESTYEYDQLDRLIHGKDGNGDTASWEYNLGDEPIGLTYPNGKSISRAYDKAGRLESVTDWLGNTTSFAYNKDSELRTTIFPSGTTNVDEYAFDRADRMSSVTMKTGAETLASLSYARDKAGQVESLISKGLPGAEEESFGYDENERLKSAGAGSYEYDNANNLTKAPGTTNAFDKASQLESATGATFSYDKEGERTKRTPSSGPATTYKYDQAGNLTAVERPEEGETPAIAESFSYDGTGLMASRTVGLSTQHLIWDSSEGLPLLLSDGENSYVYGPGGLAFEQISSGEMPTYLHQDQLGSTRLLTNSAGEVTGTASFAPYGAVAGKTGAASSPLGFAGQYTLGQSGLIYLRARFFDPATAQFLSVDPLMPVTRAPYFYARGNPLRYVDRSGLEAELEIPCWPFCPPPPIVAEPLEGAADSFNGFVNSLFGDSEEIAGSVTIAPSVLEARSSESGGDESSKCGRNPQQDKRVTERELEEAGLDPHKLKELGSGSDIYKDREGNLYEKPHGGRGPGESLGINIKDRFK